MRIHVLGLPHTVSNKEYIACAYTQKVVKFCKMFKDHTVFHYGHEDSCVEAEHVTVTTNEDLEKAYGSYDWRKNFFKFDSSDHAYQTFFRNSIKEISKRKEKNDIILPFWGSGVRPVCDAHKDLICIEPGIGYGYGHWAPYKVFESYAIYHAYYGLKSVSTCMQNWYDVVIPNYFDLDDFEYSDQKEDYLLFIGRVYSGKGIHVAIQLAEKTGHKLIIAGQGDLKDSGYQTVPKHVEVIGYADLNTRKKLMSKAKATIVASKYIEPFGGVQIESLLSGTPTITTDWGAFTENNIPGLTGYRCHTFNDFVWAVENIGRINPKNCRTFGENFSINRIKPLYLKFFQDVLNIHQSNGWYQQYSIDLEVLSKTIPKEPQRCNYEAIVSEEKPQAESISIWAKTKSPKRVHDFGCGPGIYVDSLIERGIDACGYDNDDRIPNKEMFKKMDLCEELPKETCDMAICLEVAEHIEEEKAINFIENICSNIENSGILIWSAAQPGQGGAGHINCHEKTYWEKQINKNGLRRNIELEEELLKQVTRSPYMGWFKNNLMLFIKQIV